MVERSGDKSGQICWANGLYLEWVLVGEKVHDGAGVTDDAHSLDLLAGVASVLHEATGETLHQRALGLLELDLLPAAGRVRDVACIGGLDCDVIL